MLFSRQCFRSVFVSQQNRMEVTDVSHTLPASVHAQHSLISILPHSGAFVPTDGPTLTDYSSSPKVCGSQERSVLVLCMLRFSTMSNDMLAPLQYHTEKFN